MAPRVRPADHGHLYKISTSNETRNAHPEKLLCSSTYASMDEALSVTHMPIGTAGLRLSCRHVVFFWDVQFLYDANLSFGSAAGIGLRKSIGYSRQYNAVQTAQSAESGLAPILNKSLII